MRCFGRRGAEPSRTCILQSCLRRPGRWMFRNRGVHSDPPRTAWPCSLTGVKIGPSSLIPSELPDHGEKAGTGACGPGRWVQPKRGPYSIPTVLVRQPALRGRHWVPAGQQWAAGWEVGFLGG